MNVYTDVSLYLFKSILYIMANSIKQPASTFVKLCIILLFTSLVWKKFAY